MTVLTIATPEATRKDREFRQLAEFELRQADDDALYVEGYAAVFNQPTVLAELDGIEYREQVDPAAFDEADMSDVIFNYNHGGKVVARTRNNTLELRVDPRGLFVRARLDGTEEGRRLYEEIKGGYIDRMSFSFTVKESNYDRETHMRTIKTIKKLYDVSAVDIPAYDTTTLQARSALDFFREQEEALKREKERRRRLLLLAKI